VSVSDLAIVAALVFGWGTLPARLERFDVTAPIAFVLAGLLLTHGPLAFLSVTPGKELLGVALPLTIGLGTVLALALASDNIWLALLAGAALAPTDAALGAGMMANPVVPARIRRQINVESGPAMPRCATCPSSGSSGGLPTATERCRFTRRRVRNPRRAGGRISSRKTSQGEGDHHGRADRHRIPG
jgi:hypothetical protein